VYKEDHNPGVAVRYYTPILL